MIVGRGIGDVSGRLGEEGVTPWGQIQYRRKQTGVGASSCLHLALAPIAAYLLC